MRASAVILGLALGASLAVPALAQDESARQDNGWAQPPADLPPVAHGDPMSDLDTLFKALKIAPDDQSAKLIENRIWAVWTISGSDTCNLLMARVKAAEEAKDYDLALKLLDAVIEINPDYVEAWNERATIYYAKNDYAHAISDLGEVLAREPRHFGALSGLGLMLQEIGDDKDALEAYRDALAIDPHLEHASDAVRELTQKVEGRNI
ncbi:MAG TPA: tetratricopeptide repeat protein [Xanthobacteraceae bacterium]|nr:tetratricopeptide repeat protein [Xanthobacteraceae bacterium]